MTRSSRARTALAPLLASALSLAIAGCTSDDGDSTSPGIGEGGLAASADVLQRRLTTRQDDVAAPEVWICFGDETDVPLLYVLLEPGAIAGANAEHRLGVEIDSRVPTLDGQLMFLWSATSADSVTFRSPDRGVQLDWTGVRFEANDRFRADTLPHGSIDCTREGGASRESIR